MALNDKSKKILYIVTQSELGGAQRHVLDLAGALNDRYSLLVAAGPDGGGALFDKLFLAGIRNIRLRHLHRKINLINDCAAFWEIGCLIFKEKPDVVHLHSSKAGLLGSLASNFFRPKTKVIYTSHGAAFGAAFAQPAKKIFLWTEKISVPLKDKIICVSPNEKKLWLEKNVAPENKLTVINNGLDLKLIAKILPPAEAREYLASQNPNIFNALKSQPETIKIIGTVANFYPDKGLPYLIEAAELVFKQIKQPAIFIVIGDGRERKLYEEMIKSRGLENKIILAGAVNDAIFYLKAFDIYLQPSLKEGFGYSVLEAMAANRPIIASHVGGIPEMITNKENGYLLFPRDTNALANKIIELLDSPILRQKFGEASRQKTEGFSLDRMVAKTEEIYSEK